jgi:hypothetical protein
MKMNIHNQCSGFRLIYRRHFSNGTYWNRYPHLEVDTGNMTGGELLPFLSTFEGVLTYKQKKNMSNLIIDAS